MSKPKSLLLKILMILITVVLAGLGAYMLWSLSQLDLLPGRLMIVIVILFALLILFAAVFLWIHKPYKWQKVVCWVLVAVMIAVEAVGTSYVYIAGHTLNKITTIDGDYMSAAQVVVMKDSHISSMKKLDGKTLGYLENLDTQASSAVLKDLEENGITVKEVKYEGLLDLIEALYGGKVDSIVISYGFRDIITDMDDYKNFDDETKVVDEVTYYTKRSSSTVAVDDITSTPFVILISGSDSRNGLDETARSDVNMLVAVNPAEHEILMVGIPRDLYLPMACDADAGCPNGMNDKLTHTGLYGVETTKKTIEETFDITINYTVRVNFDAVTNIVNALGGIDVYVDEGLAVDSFWTLEDFSVTEGWNSLNGEEALAFARERYAYIDGDHQRIRNQQIVLEAIFEKATSPAMVVQYNKFMDALSGAMETDMTQDEIQSLIRFQLDGNPTWTFYSYNVSGDNGNDVCSSSGSYAYVMYPWQNTIDNAHGYIMAILDGNQSLLDKLKAYMECKASSDDSTTCVLEDVDLSAEETGEEESTGDEPYDPNTYTGGEDEEYYEPDSFGYDSSGYYDAYGTWISYTN